MKKTIHVQTGKKKPGEHWKEVEAEVLGPFAYYEVELEPWTKGDPPRFKFVIAHLASGAHIPKRTPSGIEERDPMGLPSPEGQWPSEEFIERTITKVRQRVSDRRWRFSDPSAVSEEKLRTLLDAFFDAEKEVKAELREETGLAEKARREAKEAKAEERRKETKEAVETGGAIYVLTGDWKRPRTKAPTPIVERYGNYIALHRGLPQWRATSWWYVSHMPSGMALFRSKTQREARRAASLLVKEREVFWRFKDVDRLSTARRAALSEKVKVVREVMGR